MLDKLRSYNRDTLLKYKINRIKISLWLHHNQQLVAGGSLRVGLEFPWCWWQMGRLHRCQSQCGADLHQAAAAHWSLCAAAAPCSSSCSPGAERVLQPTEGRLLQIDRIYSDESDCFYSLKHSVQAPRASSTELRTPGQPAAAARARIGESSVFIQCMFWNVDRHCILSLCILLYRYFSFWCMDKVVQMIQCFVCFEICTEDEMKQ